MKNSQRVLAALALAGAALSVTGTAHADPTGLLGRGDTPDVTAEGVGGHVNKGVGELVLSRPLATVEGVNTGHII
ncbi:hypothetical protein [Streptomyces sp. NPDC048659]|uniref:hypothetical protein n=1 Tax=Streptomyces sp. NPDC048659 TaxID=3155489 RepID=UPI00341D815D